jgi:hypothetical protein
MVCCCSASSRRVSLTAGPITGWGHPEQVGQHPLEAHLPQIDHGDQEPVAIRQDRPAVGAEGLAARTTALLVAALLLGGRLRGGQPVGQCVQLMSGHASRPRVRQDPQHRHAPGRRRWVAGARLQAGQPSGWGDGVAQS